MPLAFVLSLHKAITTHVLIVGSHVISLKSAPIQGSTTPTFREHLAISNNRIRTRIIIGMLKMTKLKIRRGMSSTLRWRQYEKESL